MAEVTDDPLAAPGAKSSGRPKRAKKTLGDDFLVAVRADFRAHGAGVIAKVRTEKPDQYLKIVLSVLPKGSPGDLHVDTNSLDALSDDEIRQRIRGLEAVLRPFLRERPGLEKLGLEEPGRGEEGISQPAQGVGPQAPH
ncbi:hypothetical protein OHD62_23650 [Mesorhizobium sp. YC-39]|uniref:hypothetical protein n=1 Tax=unclassified Mesorhizobium TaxID=325217 RepID=UPI0021E7513A|nr:MULTISPECIES: hypothetical protein [unclassified Mesorhizobium]MCV3209271.1 hypothetical protein [Mesorhizobium sp. YC-2]MCV3231379.1 hypothetical protein [Mesorhizobium sp. YC-39]